MPTDKWLIFIAPRWASKIVNNIYGAGAEVCGKPPQGDYPAFSPEVPFDSDEERDASAKEIHYDCVGPLDGTYILKLDIINGIPKVEAYTREFLEKEDE